VIAGNTGNRVGGICIDWIVVVDLEYPFLSFTFAMKLNKTNEMKRNVFLFLCSVFMLVSCEKESMNYASAFEKSSRIWSEFKAASGNSYSYEVTSGSWIGLSLQTVITVLDGKVVKRSYKEQYKETIIEWTENENEIGTNSSGASPLTLDQVYDKARNEWLAKRKNAEVFFETDNQGLISLCGYVEDNCADDCFIGILITYII
jgi:hypothetical protein